MQRAGNSNPNGVNGPQQFFENSTAIYNMTQEVLKYSITAGSSLSIEPAIVVHKNRGNISKSIQSISQGIAKTEKFANYCSSSLSHPPKVFFDKHHTMSSMNFREEHLNQLRCRYQHVFSKLLGELNPDTSDVEDESRFCVHRKMLRRRHVRKEQKERARQEKEKEERKRLRLAENKAQTEQYQGTENLTAQTDNLYQEFCPPLPKLIRKKIDSSLLFPTDTILPLQTNFSPATCSHEMTSIDRVMVPSFSPLRRSKRSRHHL